MQQNKNNVYKILNITTISQIMNYTFWATYILTILTLTQQTIIYQYYLPFIKYKLLCNPIQF